ncbi:hypothetical protein AB0J28_21790 [Streptosporangium canum]|uniref:hypothetical protein n=1 Tax=Streptosporangium canum TaxID=324952 RepID=UPI00343C09D5
MTRRDLYPDDRRGVYSVIIDRGGSTWRRQPPAYERSRAAALERAGADPALAVRERLGGQAANRDWLRTFPAAS